MYYQKENQNLRGTASISNRDDYNRSVRSFGRHETYSRYGQATERSIEPRAQNVEFSQARTFGEHLNRSNTKVRGRAPQTQMQQDQSPLSIQQSIRQAQEYDQFFNKRLDGASAQQNYDIPSIIVYGINRPADSYDERGQNTYERLRKKIIDDFKSVTDRKSDIRKNLDQDLLQLNDDKKRRISISDGFMQVKNDDPKRNYLEIKYSVFEDALAALKLNHKEYKTLEYSCVIGVKFKDKKIDVFSQGMKKNGLEDGLKENQRLGKNEFDELESKIERYGFYRLIDRVYKFLMPIY